MDGKQDLDLLDIANLNGCARLLGSQRQQDSRVTSPYGDPPTPDEMLQWQGMQSNYAPRLSLHKECERRRRRESQQRQAEPPAGQGQEAQQQDAQSQHPTSVWLVREQCWKDDITGPVARERIIAVFQTRDAAISCAQNFVKELERLTRQGYISRGQHTESKRVLALKYVGTFRNWSENQPNGRDRTWVVNWAFVTKVILEEKKVLMGEEGEEKEVILPMEVLGD